MPSPFEIYLPQQIICNLIHVIPVNNCVTYYKLLRENVALVEQKGRGLRKWEEGIRISAVNYDLGGYHGKKISKITPES